MTAFFRIIALATLLPAVFSFFLALPAVSNETRGTPDKGEVSGAISMLEADLEALRILFYRANSLEKQLGNSPGAISMAGEFIDERRSDTIKEIEVYESQITRRVSNDLFGGESETCDLLITYVETMKPGDTAVGPFLDLADRVAERVRFFLANEKLDRPGDSAVAKARASLSGILARLEALQSETDIIRKDGPASAKDTGAPIEGAGSSEPDSAASESAGGPPIYIAFHWHMHQPIYWPYESVVKTEERHVYSYSLYEIFLSRSGPYTYWPLDAVKTGAAAGLAHLGAQVSISGSLIENLEALAGAGVGFGNWTAPWKTGRSMKTALGNPRIDVTGFGYHHPLMALIPYQDIRMQISRHREIVQKAFGSEVPYSKGIFPPENAFAEWMVPALVDEGIDWVLVDNIHMNRCAADYPWVRGENMVPPNRADAVEKPVGKWIQLRDLWAPSKVSGWAYRPHFVASVDPETGKVAKTPDGRDARMIAVPTARYLGNEDGRGGFGALNYESCLSQLQSVNDDPAHPLLVVLHHDGDNYGGGTESYYHANFSRFVEWVASMPDRFVPTTVQDYLAKFPPAREDLIHIEPGSWVGADNGDPEFHKWNGDPEQSTGYSPDRNSWGIITAGQNWVHTAQALKPDSPDTKRAWDHLLVSETSCYEYWDGTEMWDSHPARAVNEAVASARKALGASYDDRVAPTIYLPQREPYNPGALEWGTDPETPDLLIWTYVYDVSGLGKVSLEYRIQGERAWKSAPVAGKAIPSATDPKPAVKAEEFSGVLKGMAGKTIEYRVRASDSKGNTGASPVQSVFVGTGQPQPAAALWKPENPTDADSVTIYSSLPGKLHWGINGWTIPPKNSWPPDTEAWTDGKAVETPLSGPDGAGRYFVVIGPFPQEEAQVKSIEFVHHNLDGTWGKDRTVKINQTNEEK